MTACPCCGGPLDPSRFIVDLHTNTMCFNGEVIELRPKTTEFLYTLFSKYPKYATVADFTFAMWGAHDEGIDVKENIRVYVSNCRRFLAPLNIKIEGLWGEARYRLVLPK